MPKSTHPERHPAPDGLYRCLDCSGAVDKARNGVWPQRCPPCARVARLEYLRQKRNDPAEKERQRERERAWHARNPDATREASARWRARDPEHARRLDREHYWRDPEKRREHGRRYVREHPEWNRARSAAHRALMRGASIGERFGLDDIFVRDGGICHLCNKPCERRDASMDHVHPVSLGGEHSLANVKLAHLRCNSGKKDRLHYIPPF